MLEFKSVSYKNFQSVGQAAIKIQLDRSQTTVVGGFNGSGKSTLLEALSYGLFGKPLKKVNLGGLINTINGKGLVVEVEFSKSGVDYKIIRGQKPARLEFYVNGELVDQNASTKDYQTKIEYILGMDFKLFTQIVVLNKEKYVPFMELTAADRRKVVEDVLDISVFTVMNEIVKDESRSLSSITNDLKYTRERLEERIAGQRRLIDAANANVSEQVEAIEASIESDEATIQLLEEQIRTLQDEIDSKLSLTEERDVFAQRKRKFEEVAQKFSINLKNVESTVKFFQDNTTCPTCHRDIDDESRNTHIKECEDKSAEIRSHAAAMSVEYKKVADKLAEIESVVSEVQELNVKLRTLESEIRTTTNRINTQRAAIVKLSAAPQAKQYEDELNVTQAEFDEVTDKLRAAVSDEEVLNKCKALLKDDGIKAAVVSDYIEFINNRVNEYLNEMDFYLNIRLDENFNDTISSVNRQGFTYDNLSTGQKTRVNLAVWMALLEVASLKNSVVTNILFLDEILEAMDSEGVASFMKLVREKLPHKNTFVVTQRFSEFSDYFRSSIQFKLNEGFTEIV